MRKIGNFLYYSFYSIVCLIVIFLLLFALVYGNGSGVLPVFLVCIAVLMIALCKILTHKYRKLLRIGDGKFPIWKFSNLLFSFTVFNVLLIAGAVCLLVSSDDISGAVPGADAVSRSVAIIILTAGILYIWMLHCNILVVGVKPYLSGLGRFIRENVSVYLLYRLAIMVITLCASLLMVSFSSDSSSAVAQGYFMYVLEDSLNDNIATGFLSQDSTFISGFTAASSYFVLSSMALELLQKNETPPLKTRIRRMFLDKDTIILLVMTLSCVIFSILPEGAGSQGAAKWIVFGMGIVWLVSFFAFLKETQIVPYLLNYVTLTFLETILPFPAITNVTTGVLGVGVIILRIIAFASVAMMIAYMQYVQEASAAAYAKGQGNIGVELTNKMYNATILGTGIGIAGLYFGRKQIAESAMKTLIRKLIKKS